MNSPSSVRARMASAVMILGLLTRGSAAWCAESPATSTARIETASLGVVIANNEAYGPVHRAGYNGVSELRLGGWDAPNLFVPHYAGLNLEHHFSGNAETYTWDIFEPRRAPMTLRRIAAHRVELHHERTEQWPLRSRVVYEVQNDAIDMAYSGTPLEDVWRS